MTDESNTADMDPPMPMRTKVTAGIVGVLLLVAAGTALMRVESPAIRPDQTPPPGHYSMSCGLCHTLSAKAPIIGVR